MTNLFENISDKNILKLKKILKASTINYPKGVNILSNVNMDDFIAIIDNGSVQLIYNDYDGNSTILEDLKTGNIFSNLTISLNKDEVVGIAKEDTTITFIEYNQVTNQEIIKTDFYIIFIKNLIKILNTEIKQKSNRIEILTKRTTRDKLLEYFKLTSTELGKKKYIIPMTLTELSQYLSVDRSAMSRELKYLKEEGFIEIDNKRVQINY